MQLLTTLRKLLATDLWNLSTLFLDQGLEPKLCSNGGSVSPFHAHHPAVAGPPKGGANDDM